MAFRGRGRNGGGGRPSMFLSFSAKVGDRKYKRLSSIGLWPRDEGVGPIAGGSVKGEYLDNLVDDLTKAADKGWDVSVALFKGEAGGGKRRGRRDEDDDSDDDG